MKFNIKKIPNITLHIIKFIFLSVGAFIMIMPFLYMIIGSFKPSVDIVSLKFKLFSQNWTLDNYKYTFATSDIPRAYLNSIIVTVSIVLITIITSTAVGFLLAKYKFKGRELLFYVLLASMMIPAFTSLIPIYILAVKLKLTGNYLGLIFPSIMSAFNIFLMRQFIRGIPDELIESARIDGASDWFIFLKIIIPIAKPAIAIIGIFSFLGAFNDYIWPLVVISDMKLRTLPLILAKYAVFEQGPANVGASFASATIVVLPILIVYAFFQRFFIKGITLTGMKG